MAELNPQTDFKPAEVFEVEDLDTLKVLADPLRLRIRELMIEPTTVKQVAAELDIPPTKLYYHINLLEKHGLIVLVDTRIVSGIIEKHYQVAAHNVRVARHLLSPNATPGDEGMMLTINSIFDSTKEDLIRAIKQGLVNLSEDEDATNRASAGTSLLTLTPDEAKEFHKQLHDLIQSFNERSKAHDEDQDLPHYKILHTFFRTKK